MVSPFIASALSIRTVQKVGYYYPPLAALYYAGVIAVLVFAWRDFVLAARYSERGDGVVSVHAQSIAGRFKSRSSAPAYCSDPAMALDTSDVLLQAALGRICASNITCGHWFADRDIFFATASSWTLTTFLSGDPYPSAMPSPMEYNVLPLLDPSFPTLNATAKAAVLTGVFGTDHLFRCAPSYFVERPEAVTMAIAFNVTSDKLPGGHQAPTVRFWDSDGKFVQQFTGGVASLPFSSLFKIDYAQPSYIRRVNIPMPLPDALRPTIPAAVVRHLGLEATLAVSCTNFYENRIQEQVVCDARASVNYDSLGPLPKTTFSLTNDGISYSATSLTPSGVIVSVTGSGTVRYADFYAVILWGVSTFVIIEAVEGAAQLLAKALDFLRKRCRAASPVPPCAVLSPAEVATLELQCTQCDEHPRSPVSSPLS